jgi:hypothetical protein
LKIDVKNIPGRGEIIPDNYKSYYLKRYSGGLTILPFTYNRLGGSWPWGGLKGKTGENSIFA